jgi:hypothetical protein
MVRCESAAGFQPAQNDGFSSRGTPMKVQHLVAAAVAVLASAAGAQNLKPGLWEVSHKMQSASGQMEQGMGQMQRDLANMPPEQRKMVEEMMARQGTKMGPAGGGMSLKVCMTKEMVEKDELPAQQGDCTTTHQSRSGNTMKMAFSCTNPPSSGEGQITFHGPESYSMKMVMNTKVDGKPEKMNMDSSGKWLASDCGNVKPHVPNKKK